MLLGVLIPQRDFFLIQGGQPKAKRGECFFTGGHGGSRIFELHVKIVNGLLQNADNDFFRLLESTGTGMADTLHITEDAGASLGVCVIAHGVATPADEKTGKRITNLNLILGAGDLPGDFLGSAKQLRINDCRVPAVVQLIFAAPWAAGFHGAAMNGVDNLPTVPENFSGIDGVLQDTLHAVICPRIIVSRMSTLEVQLLGNTGGAKIFDGPHSEDLSDNRSFGGIDAKRVMLLLSFQDKGLVIPVRGNGTDVIALPDGLQAAAVHDLLLIFQIFISALQFSLKNITVILIGQVIGFAGRDDICPGITQDLDETPCVFQVATGKTLHLNAQNGFNGWRFNTPENGEKFRAVVNRLTGHDLSIFVFCWDTAVMPFGPIR